MIDRRLLQVIEEEVATNRELDWSIRSGCSRACFEPTDCGYHMEIGVDDEPSQDDFTTVCCYQSGWMVGATNDILLLSNTTIAESSIDELRTIIENMRKGVLSD